jgi:DNA mismatch repair protein MutS2
MDIKSIETLELPSILERLASFAAFSASQQEARSLQPTSDLEEAQRRQAETTEARKFLSIKPDLTLGNAHDIRREVKAAARGSVLEPGQLLDIQATLQAARMLRRQFDKIGESFPLLLDMSMGLEHAPDLIAAISRALDERGEILDNASDTLAEIRRQLHVVHNRLLGKLQKLLSDPKVTPMLQEALITQRDGRFVIPLRADFKGRIKSVVHDQSSSGATLFVEPLQVVELNNQMRELQLAERDEVRRILTELSRQVGEQAEVITKTVDALSQLDLAFAKARYAEALRSSEPILRPFAARSAPPHPGSVLRLLAARHPLLDQESVVPIDLMFDTDTYALVITGPNTGGKTVSLKTAGLLALMAQCGLHIPAVSGSELSVFDSIYADIGDEQSIEQSLSTFSSHITNIIHILGQASSHSLVLLDELGAGTDPQEGAALARAILGTLLDKQVTTLVATHYPEMKVFAHGRNGVRNASVEFDVKSLRPTFHLTIGLPGRSNALAIAKRLGLDPEVVEQARTMVSPEDLQSESLLEEIHQQRELAHQDRAEAEESRQRAQDLEADLTQRLAKIDEERRELLEQALLEVQAEVEQVRRELQDIQRQLAGVAQPLTDVKEIEVELKDLAEEVTGSLDEIAPEVEPPSKPFSLGDRVRLQTIDAMGVITDLDQEQAEVQVGRLRVRARLNELSHPRDAVEAQATASRRAEDSRSQTRVRGVDMQAPPVELNLRGRTVDEALEKLELRLDAAYLAGMPFIRVVHGKGTGRLRQAIRQFLMGNPYVASFEAGRAAEGGEGVTLVHLSSD